MMLITHPSMPGSEADVPESSLPFHQAAGWVVKGSPDDPELTAAERERDLALNDLGEQAAPPAEQDKAPKRRATTKDGE